jgi:predicted CoA-binding protein
MPTIAVVGAGPDRRKFSNKCVRAYRAADWTVFPIHPAADVVEGLPVFRSLAEVPLDHLDRVSVYLPPAAGLRALESFAAKSVGELWLNPGADAPEVVARARELGFEVVCDCSIVAIGFSPSQFAES